MTKKMMMFAAACLLVVFTAIPCFAQEELKDGVEPCPCYCDTMCSVLVASADVSAQDVDPAELKDCVSDACDCECVDQGE